MALGYMIESFKNGSLSNPELKALFLNLLMLQDIGFLKPNVIVEPYMHNSPLWSLSYEWWFYMLYFPIQNFIRSKKTQSLVVFSIAIASSLAYGLYPEFIPRVLMYISIWWTGVFLSNKYIANSSMSIYELKIPLVSLFTICIILSIQTLTFISSGHSASIGIHPFLEARHHVFALLVIILAIAWNKHKWIFFDKIFAPFAILAPMSYVIYISHYYLVANANYLAFLNNNTIAWVGYIICLLIFSWFVEIVLHPKLQRIFLQKTIASKK